MLYRICVGFFSFVIWSSTACAESFPRGCEVTGFAVRDPYLILNPDDHQTIYLIQNKFNKTIQLSRHETRDVFMSPKLETNLSPNHWAAFASDEENLYFQCQLQDDEHSSMIPCGNVLEVCRYPRARFALSNMGTYWVSTNKPQASVIKESVAKGIYLKW